MMRALRAFLGLALALALFSFTTTSQAKPAPRRAAKRATGAAYRAHVARWHLREAGARAPLDERGRPKLVLENINTKERVELTAGSDSGEFAESERARAAQVLGDTRKGEAHSVDAGLIDLLYGLQRHFDAPCVRIISAYRAGGRSQHARGLAADIVLPGVDDKSLASHARSLGGTGVGLYPRSGFVHVDVRSSPHYWVDSSGPGQRSRPVHKKHRKPVSKQGARKGARKHGG